MPSRNEGREPWSAYDGSVYALVVARLFEPLLRVPAAAAAYKTWTVWVIVGLAATVNVLVILRLRRRKRRGYLPIYLDRWYAFQLGYGIAIILLLAIALPDGLFAGKQIGPEVWVGNLGDLFSFQLFLGCALIGVRLGFRAVLPMVILAIAVFNIGALTNSGHPALEQAFFWSLWAFINSAAGALGGKVLLRMMEVGYSEEEVRERRFKAILLPATYSSKTLSIHGRLAAEWTQLLSERVSALEQAVDRAKQLTPEVERVWHELISGGEAMSIDRLLTDFGDRARAMGVQAHITTFGMDVEPFLTTVEEVYVESFLHVVVANAEPPRAHPESVSVLIDADRLWLRLRAIVRGPQALARPSDGLIHSLQMLELLTTLQRGVFAITSAAGAGEVVEARVPRSSSAY